MSNENLFKSTARLLSKKNYARHQPIESLDATLKKNSFYRESLKEVKSYCTYDMCAFYLDPEDFHYLFASHFSNCSFRGDAITLGGLRKCTFTNCNFSTAPTIDNSYPQIGSFGAENLKTLLFKHNFARYIRYCGRSITRATLDCIGLEGTKRLYHPEVKENTALKFLDLTGCNFITSISEDFLNLFPNLSEIDIDYNEESLANFKSHTFLDTSCTDIGTRFNTGAYEFYLKIPDRGPLLRVNLIVEGLHNVKR